MKAVFAKDALRANKTKLASGLGLVLLLWLAAARAYAVEGLEKEELKFGFIKLTDCAPVIIAYEKGFFEDEGLYT